MQQESDIGDEQAFVVWVKALIRLPNVENSSVRSYHVARIGRDLYQTDDVNGEWVVKGPNEQSQHWYDMELELLDAMPADLRQVLVKHGCVMQERVDHARQVMAAKERMQNTAFYAPRSVDAYLQSCVDIKLTLPIMHSIDAYFDHFIVHWKALKPPPDMVAYHAATLRLYEEWRKTGGDVLDIAPGILQDIQSEMLTLTPENIAKVMSSGCGG